MTAPGPLDLVRQEIMRRLGPEIDDRFEQLMPVLLKALNNNVPLEQVPDPNPVPAPAPKTAAVRTLLQGLLVTVLTAIVGVLYTALGDESFQIFSLGDWKTVGTTAVTTALMAVVAYGMRKLGR